MARIKTNVKSLTNKYPSADLWITGHSRGGAMTTICALYLQKHGYYAKTVITFEQPRVGNKEFAEYFNHVFPHAMRFTHRNDLVPHLPPKSAGFVHTATEMFLNHGSSGFIICDGSGEDPNCADGRKDAKSIKDHMFLFGRFSGCE